jgi:hypothetical protein
VSFKDNGDRMKSVEASALFKSLAAQHTAVEVWADDAFTQGGWSYFWIVSRFGEGNVRNLAYVRWREAELERREYDAAGDDLWVAVE